MNYHNLAVIQLKLEAPELACNSSQNARKLARLSLSFANRWMETFQHTHEVALASAKRTIIASAARAMDAVTDIGEEGISRKLERLQAVEELNESMLL